MSYEATTPNLNLPQWILSDPPQMNDFNAAFQSIDQFAGTTNTAITQIKNPYNPNLLINGNLVNAINQRSQTSFSAANQYTVDRWMLESGSAAYSAGTGLTLSNATVCQFVEGLSAFQGQVFTLSASIGDTVQTITGTLGSAAVTQGALSFVYTSTGWCKVSVSGSGTLQWIKLELGSYATPLYPKLPGEELPLCQRYYASLPQDLNIPVGQGRTGASRNPWFYFYFPVVMRANPTVVVYSANGNANRLSVTGGTEITPNSVIVSNAGARVDGGTSVSDTANVYCFYTADAEIYS